MASTIQLSGGLTNQKVDHLPPSGHLQLHHYQNGFYYRGNLFSSPLKKIHLLTQSATNLDHLGSDTERVDYVRKKTDEEMLLDETTKPLHFPVKPRRIQSAQAALEKHSVNNHKGSVVSVVNIYDNTEIPSTPVVPKRKRPSSAIILPSQRNHVTLDKSVSRPPSPGMHMTEKRLGRSSSPYNAFTSNDKHCSEVNNDVEPSVYGLKLKRQISGGDPNIFDDCQSYSDMYPYVKTSVLPTKKPEPKEDECKRSIPLCLEALRPWLTINISQDLLCLDPSSCPVFLPFLDTDFQDLPFVPAPQSPDDELPQYGMLPPIPHVFKRYRHPYINKTLKDVYSQVKKRSRICAHDGTIIHQRYQGMRTSDIIRKEILELENLMKGIGSHDSNCMMVRYQADITQLKQMVDETLAKVPERLKNIPQPTDSFGVDAFFDEHDIVMQQIQDEHDVCIVELALLEAELDLDEDTRHFSHQHQHTCHQHQHACHQHQHSCHQHQHSCNQHLYVHIPVATEETEIPE